MRILSTAKAVAVAALAVLVAPQIRAAVPDLYISTFAGNGEVAAGADDVSGIGQTTVACTATDSAGNIATGSFVVTVRDTTAPSIASKASTTVAPPRKKGDHDDKDHDNRDDKKKGDR